MRAALRPVVGGGLAIRTWQEVLPDLAAFIRVDTASNYGFDAILLILAGFTIFNTLLMSVLERRREFGVMMALGTTPRRVQAQVLVESALLATVACALGLMVGGGGALLGGWLGIDVRRFVQPGMDIGGFAVDPVLRPHLSGTAAFGLSGAVLAAVVLMALVPSANPSNPSHGGDAMTDPLVVLRNVTRDYGAGGIVTHALRGVSLEMGRGEFLALAGPSGSGKTTLLNLISGLDRPTSGDVVVDGRRVDQMDGTEAALLRRERIGFVFQAYNLFPVLTAAENAEYVLDAAGGQAPRATSPGVAAPEPGRPQWDGR